MTNYSVFLNFASELIKYPDTMIEYVIQYQARLGKTNKIQEVLELCESVSGFIGYEMVKNKYEYCGSSCTDYHLVAVFDNPGDAAYVKLSLE